MNLAKVLFRTKPTNYNCSSQNPPKLQDLLNICPKMRVQEPIQILSSHPMSSLATMLPSISIHKEAVSGRSDGPSTERALAKLPATMTISANHMATWNQDHSRPMLLTNGTGGTEASTRLGMLWLCDGACGIFRAPPHCHCELRFEFPLFEFAIINLALFHPSLWKAQLNETFLQLLCQKVISQQPVLQKPLLQVVGHFNGHLTEAQPPIRSRFACLDELWFSLIPPSLEHLLCLGLIGLLDVDISPCQLLTERHDEERGSEGWLSNHKRCVTGGQMLRKKQFFR